MPLPGLPQLRTTEGPVGTFLKEIRNFLSALKNISLVSGRDVPITFSAGDVAASTVKRVETGLGYAPTGFFIYRGHVGATLIESTPPATETNSSVLYLRATAAGSYKLWVF